CALVVVGGVVLVSLIRAPRLGRWRRQLIGERDQGYGFDLDVVVREDHAIKAPARLGAELMGQLGVELYELSRGRDLETGGLLCIQAWDIFDENRLALSVVAKQVLAGSEVERAGLIAFRPLPGEQPHSRAVAAPGYDDADGGAQVAFPLESLQCALVRPPDAFQNACL